MATKTRKRAAPARNTEALLDDLIPDAEEEDLYTFLEEVGPNISTVDIFRLNKDGSRPHVDRTTLDAVKDDVYGYLRTIGSAKYLLQFKSADRLIRKSKVIEVAGGVTPNGVVATQAGAIDHVGFLREQMAQQQTLLLALISNMGKSSAMPDLSFLSNVLKAPDLTPITALMAAMITKSNDGGGLALAQTIVKMSRDLAPADGNHEDTWLSVVKEVGGRVADAVGGAIRQPPGPPLLPPAAPPAAPPPPAATSTAAPPIAGGNPIVTRENFAQYIAQGLNYLKGKAEANKDVEVIVDYMLENVEEPHWTAVVGAIQQGATFENLLQFDPEIAQKPNLRAWFQKLYDELRDSLSNAVDSGGKGRDAEHPGDNAGAGAAGPNPPGGGATS